MALGGGSFSVPIYVPQYSFPLIKNSVEDTIEGTISQQRFMKDFLPIDRVSKDSKKWYLSTNSIRLRKRINKKNLKELSN